MKLSTPIKWLYCLLLSLPVAGFAQTINGVPLKDIDVEYLQLVGTSFPISGKLIVEIDFGQVDKIMVRKDSELRDEKDKRIKFNSMIDALNFFSANGYEFVQAYALAGGNFNVYHYLLHRKSSAR